MDPLAEKAFNWNPYRNAFDNSILYFDPNGMFEKKKDARKFRRKNSIKRRDSEITGNKKDGYVLSHGNDKYSFGHEHYVEPTITATRIDKDQSNGNGGFAGVPVHATLPLAYASEKMRSSVNYGLNRTFSNPTEPLESVINRAGVTQTPIGNYHTSTVHKAYKATNRVNRGLGYVNYASLSYQWKQGEISTVAYGIEMVSNTITTFGKGNVRIIWTLSYEGLGRRGIAKLPYYQNTMKPWLSKTIWGHEE